MKETELRTGPPRESEENGCRFRAMPVGIVTVSNRVFTGVNSRFCEMVGYRVEELIGQSSRMMFETNTEFERVGRDAYTDLRAHGAGVIETIFCHKNGKPLNVLLTSSTLMHKDGNPTDVTFNVIDVTASRQVERELFWQNRELAALHRVSEIMLSGQPEQAIFDAIAGEIAEVTDFPMVSIELCDFERAVMIYRGTCGIPLEDMPTPFEVPMDVTLSGEVAHSGSVLIETETFNRREYAAPILRRLGVRTFVCVPIKTASRVIGTLSLAHDKKTQIEPRVMVAATSLANYLATLLDRLETRDALGRSEAELAAVYDRAPSIMCLFDERLDLVRANRAAAEFTGCRQSELSSELISRKLQNKRFGDGTSEQTLRGILAETLVSGKSRHRIQVEEDSPPGHAAENASVLLLSSERIQTEGANRILMCLEDITSSVRADEQIHSQAALLDISRDAIFVRNFSNRIIYWNEGAARLYGWAAADACGKTINELDLTIDPKESAAALRAVQEREDWTGEMRQKSRDGREWVVQSRWTLMRERDGKPKAILVVNTDITEKKKLESQLLRSQRMESIGTLASGLAHDLNNVLAPIMMALEFLRDSVKDKGLQTCLQTLEMCSLRGASIIRQVLMFARGVEGERLLINPKHLILEMERIARETFSRSIQIQTALQKEPCILLGDATQIQQVLMNLCVNARDAMPRGGTLTIGLKKAILNEAGARIHLKAKPGVYVVISVADTGTGIPPELMDKIFDPFFTTKPLGQGTGLGLATTLGIAENHGGFIHVESEPEKGTTFEVYFPAASSEQEEAAKGWGQAVLSQGNGELILVVDDEPAVRRLAEIVLSRNGYRTLLAADGREGLSLYQQHHNEIKLIVSDLMMPQMDGPAMIRALREQKAEVKVITITGLGEENRMGEARAAGADVVLNKPFTAEQLLTSMKQLL